MAGLSDRTRGGIYTVRLLVTGTLLAGFAQAMTAGQFLDGFYDALEWHGIGAVVLLGCAVGMVVGLTLSWRRWNGPGWPALAGVGVIVGIVTQGRLGVHGLTALHLPLGVALLSTLTVLTAWAWKVRVIAPVHDEGGA